MATVEEDDENSGQQNVLAQMLLGANPNLLDNLSRFGFLKGVSGAATQPPTTMAFKGTFYRFLFREKKSQEG